MGASRRKPVKVVDSHTAGEPTRVVVSGGPDLGRGTMAARRDRFRRLHDRFRSAVVNEPRGSDVLVGALLTPPERKGSVAGVIFFNNVGVLGMCGHGAIGLVATLAHLGRIRPGAHRLDTPVGPVVAELRKDGSVAVENVPSRRSRAGVEVEVDGLGRVRGDVAWGGNWFFLVDGGRRDLEPAHVERLTDEAWRIRAALRKAGITGEDGAEIDHVEFFGPAPGGKADARNFVLCPGKAYDRSPCGTGTSAKAACLHADGKLPEGKVWRQEGILGTSFEVSVKVVGGEVIPTVAGRAWITGESVLRFEPGDPFGDGIRV
jgi:4-hydroxyproline epimerase